MPYKKISGIYKITNLKNNKVYIGSAISIYNRLVTHKYLLKNNKHFNRHLQSSYNKNGIENFSFEILIKCSKEKLEEKEEFMIRLFRSNNNLYGYNKRLDCSTNLGIKASYETSLKLRSSHLGLKRSIETQEKISKTQYKAVIQCDLKGNIIKEFNSIKEASILTGIPSRAISRCCTGKLNKTYNQIWKHKK